MARARSTFTRRSVVAGLALTAAPTALAGADNAYAQGSKPRRRKVYMSGWAVFSPSRRLWITSATLS